MSSPYTYLPNMATNEHSNSSSSLQEPKSSSPILQGEFPPGFHFKPHDWELIMHYLFCRTHDLELPKGINIPEMNIYDHHPGELERNFKHGIGNELYFFTPRKYKDEGGSRIKRSVNGGFWKTTSTDKPIHIGNDHIGFKKTFAFHEGKQGKATKTGWIMHEYRLPSTSSVLDEQSYVGNSKQKMSDGFVLCRIYERPTSSHDFTDAMISEGTLPSMVMAVEEDVTSNAAPCSSSEDITTLNIATTELVKESFSFPPQFMDSMLSQDMCNVGEEESWGDFMNNQPHEYLSPHQSDILLGNEFHDPSRVGDFNEITMDAQDHVSNYFDGPISGSWQFYPLC